MSDPLFRISRPTSRVIDWNKIDEAAIAIAPDRAGGISTIASLPDPQKIQAAAVPPNPIGMPPKTPADEAEFLLQVASEVEHGLLVQYLYAAYSTTNDDWQSSILNIAVQEMDHLLNVNNMLLALKRAPYFDRGNFPPSPDRVKFYPFPFQFEPLSASSLGKYVTAESPAEVLGTIDLSKLTTEQRTWFTNAVAEGKAAAKQTINHVGVLYATLYWMFQDDDTPIAPWLLPKDLFTGIRHVSDDELAAPAKITTRQGKFDEGFKGVAGPESSDSNSDHRVIWTMTSRADMRAAISQIAAQGEGTQISTDSHFLEFLQIFGAVTGATSPLPVLSIPTNPNTGNDPGTESGRITHPATALWGQLFNLRYHILLTELSLILCQSEGENAAGGNSGGRAARPALIKEAIGREMKGSFGIRGLAVKLSNLPLKADGSGLAGAPFEMPALPLPASATGHRDFLVRLLTDSNAIVDQLLNLQGTDALPPPVKTALASSIRNADALLAADVKLMQFTS